MINFNQFKAFKKEASGACYDGWLDERVPDVNEAYLFLRKALRAERGDCFRGPKEFSESDMKPFCQQSVLQQILERGEWSF